MPGFRPLSRRRSSFAGVALALLAAVACAPADARAGCHRNGVGSPPGSRGVLENLRSLGALGASQERAEAPAAPAPLGDRRGGCTGLSCSSNADPASAPPTFVPFRLNAEWAASCTPSPAAVPTATPAAAEGCEPWSNPPIVGVFHPPRRPAAAAAG